MQRYESSWYFRLLGQFSLTTQLIALFILIGLVPLSIFTFLSYNYSKKVIFEEELEALTAIVEREYSEIETYFLDKQRSLNILGRGGALVALEKIKEDPANAKIYAPFFNFYNKYFDYRNLFIISADGKEVYSTDPHTYSLAHLLKHPFINFTYKRQELKTFLSSPIYKNGTIVGAVVVELDQASLNGLAKIAENYAGLDSTGETLIGVQIEDQIVLLTPARKGGASLSLLQSALYGVPRNGVFQEGEKEVLTASRFIPLFNGGLVVKIDLDEVLKPLDHLKFLFITTFLITTLLLVLFAPLLARAFSYPLKLLTRKTKLLANGDLSQRLQTTAQNEIGLLATSFNHMAATLQNLVAQKTQELKVTQERLVSQDKLASLGILTAGIAHEIKNPLNFVNNFSTLSLDLLPILEKYIEHHQNNTAPEEFKEVKDSVLTIKGNLGSIFEQGNKASNILRKMLSHSHQGEKEASFINLNNLLEETLNLSLHSLRAEYPAFTVRIEKDFDRSLPKFKAFEEDLTHVILNLLNNAFYTLIQKKEELKKGYTPILWLSTKKHKDEVELKIKDNGQGVPHELKAKIFTPFFTTKPTGKGTGLGLSLSYNIIVNEHHGSLSFTSEEGEYSEFILLLPYKEKMYASS